jgi:hypothetical protein
MTPGAHPPKKGYRTIRLPLAESEYGRFLTDRSSAKDRLEALYEECAALFPDAFPSGYAFFGSTEPSMTQQLLCRRIRLEQGRTVFTIAPAFVMPSMTGRTQDVDHALFLRRFHVVQSKYSNSPSHGRLRLDHHPRFGLSSAPLSPILRVNMGGKG